MNNEKVSTLVSMGFSASESKRALQSQDGDMERAVDLLVSGPAPQAHPVATATAVAAPPTNQRAEQPRVQYITFSRDSRGVCYWVLNIIWILLGGWHMFLAWFTAGLVLCVTCIFFPCGYQLIKISLFLLFPFGLSLVESHESILDEDLRCCSMVCSCLLNVLWAVTIGWILALQQILTGILLCLTIIGIPFGWQCMKMSYLCFRPFGLDVTAEELQTVVVTSDDGTHYRQMQRQSALGPAVV